MEIVREESENTPTFQEPVKDKKGNTIPQWQIDIQQKLFNARKEARDKKFKELAEHYNGKLNSMMDMYFTYLTDDEDENTESFNIINKEWIKLAGQVNSTQKIIEINPNAFSVNVKAFMETEEFKNRKKVETENVDQNIVDLENKSTEEETPISESL